MTSHKISLNGKLLCTAAKNGQYRVITIVNSFDRLDAGGFPVPDSSLTVDVFNAMGNPQRCPC
jgi:hypothetical protein